LIASQNGQKLNSFWENIICRFGLPGVVITDNGKQFAEEPFNGWCTDLHIKQMFTAVAHPQANGQVERTNRSIVEGSKERLGKTPFALTFGSEAIIPPEIGVISPRKHQSCEDANEKEVLTNLELLEEERDRAREAK
jgi:transposase InsO family protein